MVTTTTTTRLRQVCVVNCFLLRDQLWKSLVGDHQLVASLGGGVSGGCVRCSNSSRSAWPWPTVIAPLVQGAHRERRPTGTDDSHQGSEGEGGTEFYALSEDSDVVGGGRPPSLVDVWPQEQVQQRTVEQIVDPVPSVPLLHDVVPEMVEQLVDFLAPFDFRVAKQVIEVPKIVCPQSSVRRRRQNSWWKC